MLHLRELERQCAARLSAGRMCHASTVLPLESGEVLCAFFSGSHEGSADTSIYLSRRTPEGVWNEGADPAGHKLFGADEAHWNPVLFEGADGKIWLFYKVASSLTVP